jgi:tetratricopeptide (TPR) repeat protein
MILPRMQNIKSGYSVVNSVTALLRLRNLVSVLFVVGLLAVPHASAATADPAGSFERARESWLRDRLKDVTRSLILQEELLVFRLESILEEAARTGDLDDESISRLLESSPPHVLSQAPEDSTRLDERLDYWMARQQEILAFKLDASMQVRRRLVGSAPVDRQLNLFRKDLSYALQQYAAGHYALAALLLEELLDLYPYSNVDDLLFHLAEAHLADGAWDSAVENYLQLLRTYPESSFRQQAFRHLLYVRSLFQQHATAVAECAEFEQDLKAARGDVAWLAGREHFLNEDFRAARRILEGVGSSDPVRFKARHLMGLTQILESRFEDAIVTFEGLLAEPLQRGFGKDPNEALRSDARLKLGYLYFESGRFAEAASMFEAASKDGQYPEALLGQAWSGMSLADHDRALSLSRELVDHYPASPLRYEAMTLAGYATEQMDGLEDAREWYDQVLDEAERSEEMRDLAAERRQVLQMLRQMVEMEPKVFAGDGGADFEAYLDLRRRARVLMRKVKYSELQTANENMQAFVNERQSIVELSQDLRRLIDSSGEAVSQSARQELAALHRESRSLMNKIRLAGFVEIQRQPLMIHERTLQSLNSMLDSLALGSTAELQRLDRLEGSIEGAAESNFAALVYRNRFDQYGQQVERIRSGASALRRKPINSNLGRWSELAFSRIAIGDIQFEELQGIEDRLKELDGYLQRIDELLEGVPASQAPAPEAIPDSETEPTMEPMGEEQP